jgi:RNA polymerase sigma-70 factor (ECF subfamily)
MQGVSATLPADALRSRFETIALPHRRGVWTYILKLTGDCHAADDLCQEVLVRAFQTFGSLLDEVKVRSWLFSIAYHVTVDWMRRRSSERRLKRALERKAGAEAALLCPERAAIRREEARLARCSVSTLWSLVESLPPIYREVVRLRYRRGLSLARIAAQVKVPVGNVKVRLHRARRRLAREMEAAGTFLRPNL